MLKTIRIFSVFLILSFVTSCSSAPSYSDVSFSNEEAMAGRGFNSGSNARMSEVDTDRMITYTANLSLSVKNVDDTRKIILEKINDNKGFITRASDNSISARIPAVNLDGFLNQIKPLGKVENESKTGVDITDQYRDNVIRLENLKNLRTRYLALLEKANTVADILSIEKELERVNTEIDIMEGRVRYAEASVEYSNVTVRFTEKSKPGPIGWIFVGLYRGIKWLFVWN